MSWCRGECGECYLQHLDTSPPPPVTSHRVTCQDTAQRRYWMLDIFKILNGNKAKSIFILKSREYKQATPPPSWSRVASDGQSRQCRAQIRGQVSEQRSPGEEKRNALCRNLWENMENSPQSSAIQLDQKLRDHRLNCVGLRTGAPGSQHFPLQARDIQAAGSFLPLLIHFIVRV